MSSFQIKDFLSIVASMINHVRGSSKTLTDFNVGSVNRTMIEAPAIELDELYQQMLNAVRDAIPASTYLSFNFAKLAAVSAYTDLTFTVSPVSTSSTVIPAGSVYRVPNGTIGYSTNSELIIQAGTATGTVTVTADQSGAVGNALVNTITSMDVPITNVTVTNGAAVITGRDIETDEAQKIRFADYIQSLSRGPLGSIEYGARTTAITDSSGSITESVIMAKCVEPFTTDNTKPLGYINCYIYNGSGSTSAALQALCQKVLNGYYDTNGNAVPGWSAAGITCTVVLVTEQAQDVTFVLTYENGYDGTTLTADGSTIPQSIATAITSYIQALNPGETLVFDKLINLAMSFTGVANLTTTTPTADVVPLVNVKITPGTISIS